MLLNLHELGEPGGEPLVCLHGLSGHGERWRRLAERLGDRRVLAPDLRGHGRSGWDPPWDLATHVADTLETIAAAGVERADWAGFSFGGRLLAELATIEPGRVARACLLDPALHIPPAVALEYAADERQGETFASADEAIAAVLARGTLFSTPRELLVEEAQQHLEPAGDGRLRWRYSNLMAVAAFGDLARPEPPVAALPTLLVTGTRSWIPVDVDRYAAALGPQLRHVTLDSGHSLLWDAFEETTDAVSGFLRD